MIKEKLTEKGLTLVETMIVICILSLILAVALPNFLRAHREADARICVTNLKQIDTAKDRWTWSTGAGLDDVIYLTDLVPDFIKFSPVCPSGGTYILGTVSEIPTCTIGTNATGDLFDDHDLQY